jgi:hypothetical protein
MKKWLQRSSKTSINPYDEERHRFNMITASVLCLFIKVFYHLYVKSTLFDKPFSITLERGLMFLCKTFIIKIHVLLNN